MYPFYIITLAICIRTFAQKMALINWMLTTRQARQSKKMEEARVSLEECKTITILIQFFPFLKCVYVFGTLFIHNVYVFVSMYVCKNQLNKIYHRIYVTCFAINLRNMFCNNKANWDLTPVFHKQCTVLYGILQTYRSSSLVSSIYLCSKVLWWSARILIDTRAKRKCQLHYVRSFHKGRA
jgi:hypothetical protein